MVPTRGKSGPFHVEAELWYQPIAFRWAHNLAPYQAIKPQRMVKYFKEASSINFRRSVIYGFGVLATAFAYRFHHLGLRKHHIFAPDGKHLVTARAEVARGNL